MRLTVLVLFVYFVVPAGSTTVDDVKKILKKADKEEYDKRIRPLKNQTNALEVKVDIILDGVIDFDQTKQELSTIVELTVRWQDELLVWDEKEFGGLEGLHFPKNAIWKPDLRLVNILNPSDGFGHGDHNLWVTSDGNVSWKPLAALKSHCHINTKNFPYDWQTCELVFQSACYSESQLKLFKGEVGFNIREYHRNSEWGLANFSKPSEHQQNRVKFVFELQRRSSYYMIHIFAPIILVTLLCPCTFLLPGNEGSRSSFAGMLFLTYGVFLTNVATLIPRNAEALSIMSVYILFMMCVNALIAIISLVQFRATKNLTEEDLKKLICKKVHMDFIFFIVILVISVIVMTGILLALTGDEIKEKV